MLYQDGDLSDG